MDTDEVEAIVNAVRPLLAGKSSPIQGAALADLLAIWLAGHFATGNQRATAAIRERLLKEHIETVRKLIPLNEEAILLGHYGPVRAQ